jgi:very-short-patch-repair endonuclease
MTLIANYIVDFCAPSANLVVEVDGSQHLQDDHAQKDQKRDEHLAGVGLNRSSSGDIGEKRGTTVG